MAKKSSKAKPIVTSSPLIVDGKIQVLYKPLYEDTIKPTFAHEGDACMDVFVHAILHLVQKDGKDEFADIGEDEIVIQPNHWAIFGLGFALAVPEGYYMSKVPRSGLSMKRGLTIINSPTTVDAGYRAEVLIGIVNEGVEPQIIKKRDKIAQMLLKKLENWELVDSDILLESERGMNGIGSTGVSAKPQ